MDRPAFLVALWPREAIAAEVTTRTAVIQLKERLGPPLFALCVRAFEDSGLRQSTTTLELRDVLPSVDIQPTDASDLEHHTSTETPRRLLCVQACAPVPSRCLVAIDV